MSFEVKEMPLDALSLWEDNPRTISRERFKALVKSMREDPEMLQARPLVALADGRVIMGNMRLRAAKELGWEKIATVQVDLDEKRALEWALRDNVPYGEWEEQGLAEILYRLNEMGGDLEMTGLEPGEVDKLLDSVSGPENDLRGTDLSLADVSIGDPEYRVERGDVYRLGPHTLICDSIYDGWPTWTKLLKPGMMFVPYPTPTLPLTDVADKTSLLLVQPDEWLAGHVLQKYAAVRGEGEVAKL